MPSGASWSVVLMLCGLLRGEPQTWCDLAAQLAGSRAGARDAAIEKFIAAKGGTPIIENQTRLIFLAKDKDGQTPRIVGDFNAWAATPKGYDVSIGKTTRIEGTSWSYLESTSYTNARLEYGFLFDKEYTPDPLNQRVVQAYAGPRSEVRMPFFVAQPEVDELGSAPEGELIAETFDSRSLGGKRRVWFYLPPGYAGADGHAVPGDVRPRRLELRREDGRAAGARPSDREQGHSAGDRGVLGARRSAGGILAQPEMARVHRRASWCRSVDKRFRTFPTPDHRVILGSSLAAYGAVDLAVAPRRCSACARPSRRRRKPRR